METNHNEKELIREVDEYLSFLEKKSIEQAQMDNDEKLIEMGIASSNIIKNHAPETVAGKITRGINKYIDL